MLTTPRYNWITDGSAHAIHNLIAASKLAYLNMGPCALTNAGLNEILRAAVDSPSLLFLFAKSIHPQSKITAAIKDGQEHSRLSKLAHETFTNNVRRVYGTTYYEFMENEKRWLVNDETDVRKIDSVYRNRDAGLARRGLTTLNKYWDEDDETLEEVMKAAVGPTCSMRKPKVSNE